MEVAPEEKVVIEVPMEAEDIKFSALKPHQLNVCFL